MVNLSLLNFSNYSISPIAEIIRNDTENRNLKGCCHRYTLIDDSGKPQIFTFKTLYRLVFSKEFCIDTIPNLEGETWKKYSETYYVSNLGRVKSYTKYKAFLLQQTFNSNGYLRVNIDCQAVFVHKLVAYCFCEKLALTAEQRAKGERIEIHHKNKVRTDNRAENLVYMTRTEHRKLHKGERYYEELLLQV